MSLKIIDSENPILLLDNFNIQKKQNKICKKSSGNLPIDENAFVCLTHFNTLFKNRSDLKQWQSFVRVNSSSDIIHSTVGLFDICLPDMDLNTIYNSTVDKEAFTIVIFSSKTAASARLRCCIDMTKDKLSQINKIKDALSKEKFTEALNEDLDVFSTAEENEDDFKLVYDDLDGDNDEKVDEESSEEEEDEDDFSQGYNSYMRAVYQRKLRNLEKKTEDVVDIGFEDQIIGAISFKLRFVECRKIVHITLLAVHKSYRQAGIGRHLLNLVLSPKVVGPYEAVVVHADFSASDFFKRFGFTDDSLLNTQWHSLEPEYTNCSLLTFLPPYSGRQDKEALLAEEFSTAEMEVDIKLWQKKVIEVHSFQFQAFQRMKMEIKHLKETIKNQDRMMKLLMNELRDSNKERIRYGRYLKSTMGSDGGQLHDALSILSGSDEESIPSSFILEDNIESKVKAHFKDALDSSGQTKHMHFVSFTTPPFSSILQAEYQATKRSIEVLSLKPNCKAIPSPRILYFCEPFSLSRVSKEKIPFEGFTRSHRKPGSHGYGYYFASNPATAAVYSSECSIIVAEVALGNICNLQDEVTPQLEEAPKGYNAVRVSSLCALQENNSATDPFEGSLPKKSYNNGEEFVIFDGAQALPLGVITYRLSDS